MYLIIKKKQVPLSVVNIPNTQEQKEPEDSKRVCYYKETEGEGNSDFAFTSIVYADGNSVSGVINWIPGEKDSLVGSYIGTIEDNADIPDYSKKLKILYTAEGEGIRNIQEEILIISKDSIKTGIGEKYEDKSGVYRFKDSSKLTYENSLPQVDCSTVPERISTNYIK